MILVDTNVWSHAFRRPTATEGLSARVRERLRTLRVHHELVVPGIALQELLSCLRDQGQVTRMRQAMAPIRVLVADLDDHHRAADIASVCRWRGVATTSPDCLIAAQAIRSGGRVLTFDGDFELMALHVPELKMIPV